MKKKTNLFSLYISHFTHIKKTCEKDQTGDKIKRRKHKIITAVAKVTSGKNIIKRFFKKKKLHGC